jgi:hypothetical protein
MRYKKFHIIIAIAHSAVIFSMFFPLINVNALRLGVSANEASPYFMNVINYMQTEIYPLTGIIMISLMILSTLGAVNSMMGIFSKKIRSINVKLAFIFGFSEATLAALLLYSQSTALFIISVVSFVLISVASIKLIRIEERENEQK